MDLTAMLVDAIDMASPSDLDKARAECEEHAIDFEIKATKRATWKRLAKLLRKEMGPL